FKLTLDELTTAYGHAGYVNARVRALRRERRQPAVVDGFGDRELINDVIEKLVVALVEPTGVQTVRRRRETAHAKVRFELAEGGKEPPVNAALPVRHQVRLVDNNEVTDAETLRIAVDAADRCQHDLCIRVALTEGGAVDAIQHVRPDLQKVPEIL